MASCLVALLKGIEFADYVKVLPQRQNQLNCKILSALLVLRVTD